MERVTGVVHFTSGKVGNVVWFTPLLPPEADNIPRAVKAAAEGAVGLAAHLFILPVGIVWYCLYEAGHRLGWNDGKALRK